MEGHALVLVTSEMDGHAFISISELHNLVRIPGCNAADNHNDIRYKWKLSVTKALVIRRNAHARNDCTKRASFL